MSRAITEVLQAVYNRMELNGSAYISLDQLLALGDVTRVEYVTAERMLGRWSSSLDEHTLNNQSLRRQSLKTFIKKARENESMSAR